MGNNSQIITVTSPLAKTAGNISIPQANSTTSGFLSSADWNTFNEGAGGGGAATWQAAVSTASSLPSSGNANGDARVAEDTGNIWVWVSTAWVNVSNSQITPNDLGNVSGSVSIDWSVSPEVFMTLTGNVSITHTNFTVGKVYSLTLIQDSTGGRTATWDANSRFSNQTPPTLTTIPYFADSVTFFAKTTSDMVGGPFVPSWKPSSAPNPPDPTTISGLTLWLDGSDATSMTAAGGGHPGNGSSISQWNDKSTNSFNATQSTGGSQPTYLSATLNHNGGVSFNGSSFMGLSTVPDTGEFWKTASTGLTVFAIFYQNAYSGSPYHGNIFNGRDEQGYNRAINIVDDFNGLTQSLNISSISGHGANCYVAPLNGGVYQKFLLTYTGNIFSASNNSITLNGTSQSINTPGSNLVYDAGNPTATGTEQFTTPTTTVGGTPNGGASNFNGLLLMLCCFSGVLNSSQIQVLNNYTFSKYGI